MRSRAVIHALSVALFGRSGDLPDFPSRMDLRGVGLSDEASYAEGLSRKLSYVNTWYHEEPLLDITAPPAELDGTLDFLISSDVFEHVAPPVERAFENSFRLLKPGGVMILTVPVQAGEQTTEHFPSLNEYEVIHTAEPVLVNKTVAGETEVFRDLRFHGGPGAVLEMRIFSRPSLLQHLQDAGFREIREWDQARPDIGIPRPGRAGTVIPSFPITARR